MLRIRIALVSLTVSLAASGALAADPWDAPFSIQIGAFRADAETSVRFDSDGGRLGTQLSFEGDLGMTKTKTLPTFDLLWRFNPRHALEGSWVALERSGGRTLTGAINWGDVTFPVSTTVDSRFESNTIRVAYRYSPINEAGNELSLLLGAHYTKLKASISGTQGTLSDEASLDFPLPTLGVRGSAKFAETWRVTGFAQALKVKVGDYDGELLNAAVAIEWAFLPNAYAGLAYNYYKYDLESTKSHGRGQFNYTFDGPSLYVGWSFR